MVVTKFAATFLSFDGRLVTGDCQDSYAGRFRIGITSEESV